MYSYYNNMNYNWQYPNYGYNPYYTMPTCNYNFPTFTPIFDFNIPATTPNFISQPYSVSSSAESSPSFKENSNLLTQTTIQPKATENKKTEDKGGMSSWAKLALGAVAVAGVCTLAYFCLRNKNITKTVNDVANKVDDVTEKIDFTPAKTVEEAKKFAKEKLGVAVDGELSLDVLNFANEGLCTLRNKSPKTFNIKWIESNPVGGGYHPEAIAQIVHLKSSNDFGINFCSDYIKHIDDVLSDFIKGEVERGAIKCIDGKLKYQEFFAKADISSDIITLANKFKENPAKLNLKEKVKLHMGLADIGETMDRLWGEHNGDISKLTKNIKINSSPFHTIYHEQGHILHRMNIPDKFAKLDHLEILKANNINTSLTEEFLNSHKNTALKVTDYASESPAEFVAEVYAKCLMGQTFSDDVMALYKKYGGPALP